VDIAFGPALVRLETEVISTGRRLLLVASVALAIVTVASAGEWSRARIRRLPDSAFAVVEVSPEGRRLRHLPHHDETGALDLPHLKAARSRLGQVKWLDPANAAIARHHLEEHWKELGRE
jgi:hypothetical protein